MPAAEGVSLNHVARISSDIKRLAEFYKEMFGFEQVEPPKFLREVIWLQLPSSFLLHLIQKKDPDADTLVIPDPKNTVVGHHMCFSVSNYDSFTQTLQEKGIQYKEMTLSDGKTKQAFFFDPDGNALEACGLSSKE